MRSLPALMAGAFCLAASGHPAEPIAPEPPIDKSGYTIFNPTPRKFMRELSADRPDKTESAYTVDAGHFQVEMDVLNYSYDRHTPARDQTRFERVSIAPMNLKLGLLNNVDFHLNIDSYTSMRAHDFATGAVETHRGFGDIVPRIKVNLWGNDGGKSAAAIMPFVKLPTSQDQIGNNSVEGGLLVPFAFELPFGFDMGSTDGFEWNRDSVGSGRHAEIVNTLTFGHNLIGALAGYIELFSNVSTEQNAPWVATIDAGLTYQISADVRLDAGMNIGVTRAAEDWNPFMGLTWRF
jgi:hypothetical protein